MFKKVVGTYRVFKLLRQAKKEGWSEDKIDKEVGALFEENLTKQPADYLEGTFFADEKNDIKPKVGVPEDIKKIWGIDESDLDEEEGSIQASKELQNEYLECVRRLVFAWDPCESGAPMVSVNNPYGSEDMFVNLANVFNNSDNSVLAQRHLEVSVFLMRFMRDAELPDGMYEIKNTTFKALSEQLPERTYTWANERQFHFKKEHRLLLSYFCFRWLIGESVEERLSYGYPTVGVDPKRPYGAFSYHQLEMAEILDYRVLKNEDGECELPDGLDEKLTDLHFEMLPAIQVFVEHAMIDLAPIGKT